MFEFRIICARRGRINKKVQAPVMMDDCIVPKIRDYQGFGEEKS